MSDYIWYVLQKRNVTPYTIFYEAYEHHFGNGVDVTGYVRDWARTGVLPYFVRTYLEDIRDKPFI